MPIGVGTPRRLTRQLAIGGKFDEEARPLFKKLSEAYVAFREKKRVQGVILDSSGTPKEFVGTVILLRDTYGFIKCDALGISVFISTTGDDTADCIEYAEPIEICELRCVNLRSNGLVTEPVEQSRGR